MSKSAPRQEEHQPGDVNPSTGEIWALCTLKGKCSKHPRGRWVNECSPLKLAAARYVRRCVLIAQQARKDRGRKLKVSPLDLLCGSTVNRGVRRRDTKTNKPKDAQLICGICGYGKEFVAYRPEEELKRTVIFCSGCTPWSAVAFRPEHMAEPGEPTPQRDDLFATLRYVRGVMEGRIKMRPSRERTPFLLLAKDYVEQNPHAAPAAGKSQWLHIRHLAIYFAHTEVGQISEEQADEFERSMLDAGALEESTTDRIIQTLRLMFRHAVLSGWIPSNPLKNRKARVFRQYRDDRIMTFDEERRLRAACVGELADLIPVLTYIADAPASLSDYMRLRLGDIDFHNNLIPGKRGLVDMTPRLREAMISLCGHLGELPEDKLTSHTRDELSHAFYRACAQAGVKGLRMDTLRRTGGWRLRAAGYDYDYLSYRLGIGLSQVPKFLEVDRQLVAAELASSDSQTFMRKQFGRSAQARNGSGQKVAEVTAQKQPHGGPRHIKLTPDQKEEFVTRYDEVLPRVRSKDLAIPEDVLAKLLLPGNSPSDVARDYVAGLMGIESNDYLRSVITQVRKRRRQNALHSSST
jgi:integrase